MKVLKDSPTFPTLLRPTYFPSSSHTTISSGPLGPLGPPIVHSSRLRDQTSTSSVPEETVEGRVDPCHDPEPTSVLFEVVTDPDSLVPPVAYLLTSLKPPPEIWTLFFLSSRITSRPFVLNLLMRRNEATEYDLVYKGGPTKEETKNTGLSCLCSTFRRPIDDGLRSLELFKV